MNDLNYFLNDKYIVLKTMIDNEVKSKTETYVPLSMSELSDITNFSKTKIFSIIRDLSKHGYIKPMDRSKYLILKKGYTAVNALKTR